MRKRRSFKKELNQFEFLSVAKEVTEFTGFDIYIVGGFVRDLILSRNKFEIDFLVVGDGSAFATQFAKELGISHINIFKNFGTAHFKYGDYDFEFVGARKESYNKDSRNPSITNGTFEDDIHRRDFTINSLAISLNKKNFGKVVDIFNGYEDIKNKLIKTPLDPFVTFNDDPLRIMRGIRFASQLGFEISESTLDAMNQMRTRLSIISQERITDELFKILASPIPSVGLKYLYDTQVLHIIFPEIANLAGVEQRKDFHHKDVFYHTCQVVDNIAQNTDDVYLRFAALVHDIAKPYTKRFVEGTGWTFHGHEDLGAKLMKSIFIRLKLPMYKLEYIKTLVKLHLRPIALAKEIVTDSAIRRLIVEADEFLEDLITLCRADITSKNPNKVTKYLKNYDRVMGRVLEVKEKDRLRAFQSPVRGEEIMTLLNLKPSKIVGVIKTSIEEAILEGIIPNTYEVALEYLMQNYKRWIEEYNNSKTLST
ncbi:MAG: CCA tRNA nucleotidyltransferase [Ignavibacteria bacterium]|nr:CCA tRNA nucleotidyltransferase [Ignavibacteria bacterium]